MEDINKYRCIHLADKGSGDELCKAIEKIKELERQIKIKDEYLKLMWFIGADYDGYETPDGLKSVIDNLMDLCQKAGNNNDTYAIYEGCGDKYYNILNEEVPKPKEEE